jgi:hypothetical protein
LEEKMKKIYFALIAMSMLFCTVTTATAQISIGIGLPNVSIGINLPLYPELVRVPGYPVYYAPRLSANYFFYDGMYWVYQDDYWYASSWYNGPWSAVGPDVVPLYILRVPVRYYRQPPVYFRDWHPNSPPRWGHHWGPGWERQHRGWDNWKRESAPRPAPLPVYQRQYTGDRYPRVEQQHTIHSEQYRHQPRDKNVRQYYNRQAEHRAPVNVQRENPQPRGESVRKPVSQQPAEHQRGPAMHDQRPQAVPVQREQPQSGVREQVPRAHERQPERGDSRDSGRGQGHGQGQGQGQRNDDERGQGRGR